MSSSTSLGAAAWRSLAAAAVAAARCHGARRRGHALDGYLAGLKTWQAQFTQTLRDARRRKRQQVSGRLVDPAPGKFRWECLDGRRVEQLIVADGRNLWFFDADLEQVTVKPLDAALRRRLRCCWRARASSRQLSGHAVRRQRRARVGRRSCRSAATRTFVQARLGFGGGELKAMVLEDKLGQQRPSSSATCATRRVDRRGCASRRRRRRRHRYAEALTPC